MTTPYYHGQEQQYTFYQLPKQLLKDAQYQDISLDARILYCLLLDRMQLSQKNGWKDEAGQTYIIYTQNEIMKDLSCSSRSVTRMLKDLEEAGMIARKRQTMYRPWWIYVHPLRQSSQKETSRHFQTTSPEETKGSVLMCQRETTETPEGNNMRCQRETTEVPNGNNMSSQEEMTGSFRMASHDTPKRNDMSSQEEITGDFQMTSHDTPNGNNMRCQKEIAGDFQMASHDTPKGNNVSSQEEITGDFQMASHDTPNGNNMSSQKEITGDFQMASHDTPNGNNMSSQEETASDFQMASHDTPNGNTNKNNINYTEYIKTEESDNDFSKNKKAEAEEALARAKDSPVKASAYQEHQYKLEMTYAQKGAEAEAAKQIARQDWWPENFLELSLDQRAELWRQQTRKQQKE